MYVHIGIKSFAFTLLTLTAVTYSFSDLTTVFCFFEHSILFYVLFFCLLLFFFSFVLSKGLVDHYSLMSAGIGVFAGMINVLGRNFLLFDGLQFFYKESFLAFPISLLAAIGYGLFYVTLFELGWKYLKTDKNSISNNYTETDRINYIIFEKRPCLYPFLFIIAFWLPYFIAFFPGVLHYDSMYALMQYYGIREWTNHFPPIGVLLMGYAMDIGKFFGNDNFGCTIYIVLQMLLFALTLAYSFCFYKKWKTNYCIRWAILLVFSLCPWFPMYGVNEIKDTLYYIAVLWLLYIFLMCFEKYNVKVFIYTIFSVMCVCFFRKEGIIICCTCILSLLALRHFVYDQWSKITASIVIGVVFSCFIQNAVIDYYRIKPGSMREALSIPVQQTARYIRNYRKDITQSEWKVLNEVFNNNSTILGDIYEPNRSDAVKFKMKSSLSKSQIKDYFNVWRKHFLRHPSCYFSALFNQMYGYFYIEKPEFYDSSSKNKKQKNEMLGFFTKNFTEEHEMYNKNIVVIDSLNTMNLRISIINYFSLWIETPFFDITVHPGTYSWLLLFSLTYVLRLKKYKYLFLYCVPIAILAVCCLSPLNASIRYSFPVVLSSLILLPFSISITNEDNMY